MKGQLQKASLVAVASLVMTSMTARAAVFSTSNTADAGTYGTITAQGFSPATTPNPDPGLATGTTVYLNQFQFFKGSPQSADSSPNFELVILNGAFPNLTGLTTTSAAVVGISSNVIASTATYNSGDAITFNFSSLPLTYDSNYAAGLFMQVGTTLTPVQVSALTANYIASGSDYVPTTNYGGLDNYNEAADYGVNGGYYSSFNHGGDTNFYATLSTTASSVPEPATALIGLGVAGFAGGRRRRRQSAI